MYAALSFVFSKDYNDFVNAETKIISIPKKSGEVSFWFLNKRKLYLFIVETWMQDLHNDQVQINDSKSRLWDWA